MKHVVMCPFNNSIRLELRMLLLKLQWLSFTNVSLNTIMCRQMRLVPSQHDIPIRPASVLMATYLFHTSGFEIILSIWGNTIWHIFLVLVPDPSDSTVPCPQGPRSPGLPVSAPSSGLYCSLLPPHWASCAVQREDSSHNQHDQQQIQTLCYSYTCTCTISTTDREKDREREYLEYDLALQLCRWG